MKLLCLFITVVVCSGSLDLVHLSALTSQFSRLIALSPTNIHPINIPSCGTCFSTFVPYTLSFFDHNVKKSYGSTFCCNKASLSSIFDLPSNVEVFLSLSHSTSELLRNITSHSIKLHLDLEEATSSLQSQSTMGAMGASRSYLLNIRTKWRRNLLFQYGEKLSHLLVDITKFFQSSRSNKLNEIGFFSLGLLKDLLNEIKDLNLNNLNTFNMKLENYLYTFNPGNNCFNSHIETLLANFHHFNVNLTNFHSHIHLSSFKLISPSILQCLGHYYAISDPLSLNFSLDSVRFHSASMEVVFEPSFVDHVINSGLVIKEFSKVGFNFGNIDGEISDNQSINHQSINHQSINHQSITSLPSMSSYDPYDVILEGDCQSSTCSPTTWCNNDNFLLPVPIGYYSVSCHLYPCTKPPNSIFTSPSMDGHDNCDFACINEFEIQKGKSCVPTPLGFKTSKFSDVLIPCPNELVFDSFYGNRCEVMCNQIDHVFDGNQCTLVSEGFFSPLNSSTAFKCTMPSRLFKPISQGFGKDNCEVELVSLVGLDINEEKFNLYITFDFQVETSLHLIEFSNIKLSVSPVSIESFSVRIVDVTTGNLIGSSILQSKLIKDGFFLKISHAEESFFYLNDYPLFKVRTGVSSDNIVWLVPAYQSITQSITIQSINIDNYSEVSFNNSPFNDDVVLLQDDFIAETETCDYSAFAGTFPWLNECISDFSLGVDYMIANDSLVFTQEFSLISFILDNGQVINSNSNSFSIHSLLEPFFDITTNVSIGFLVFQKSHQYLISSELISLSNYYFRPRISPPLFSSFEHLTNTSLLLFCSSHQKCFGSLTTTGVCPVFEFIDESFEIVSGVTVINLENNSLINLNMVDFKEICFYSVPFDDVSYLPSLPVQKAIIPLLNVNFDYKFNYLNSFDYLIFDDVFYFKQGISLPFEITGTYSAVEYCWNNQSWKEVNNTINFDTSRDHDDLCLRVTHPDFLPSIPFCINVVVRPAASGSILFAPSRSGSRDHVMIAQIDVDSSDIPLVTNGNVLNQNLQNLLREDSNSEASLNCNRYGGYFQENSAFCLVSSSFEFVEGENLVVVSYSPLKFPFLIANLSIIRYDFPPNMVNSLYILLLCLSFSIVNSIIIYFLVSYKDIRQTRFKLVSKLRSIGLFYSEGECSLCKCVGLVCSTGAIVNQSDQIPNFNATLGKSVPNLGAFADEVVEFAIKSKANSPFLCRDCFQRFKLGTIKPFTLSNSIQVKVSSFKNDFDKSSPLCSRHLVLDDGHEVSAKYYCEDCSIEGTKVNLCEFCFKCNHIGERRHHRVLDNVTGARVLFDKRALFDSQNSSSQFQSINQFQSISQSFPSHFGGFAIPSPAFLIQSLQSSFLRGSSHQTPSIRIQAETGSPARLKTPVEETLTIRTPQSVAIDLDDESFAFDTLVFE
ncbi:hypothetical protein P9112_012906 [Eukaryota sp. TZLM1-RC]